MDKRILKRETQQYNNFSNWVEQKLLNQFEFDGRPEFGIFSKEFKTN